ncbi:DAK2 domain-containing protein [Cellulomonas chengniuliangii]|uniref:DAK2 domain-containing protein n=1 Tax=Cellulomonas chengniuliangii TaxID=2968084 RepID=UPI001D0E9B26|nr:DAK2 domain-containing protein [Cellulomonas chengniuliangii]MCC2318169.1 DAK2 domain-containing protein [Cellulomonas chengniuliangii]
MRLLDGTAVRAWALAAQEALAGARDRIDAVNVFPVADSDTGTNLHLTVAGGAAEVAALPGEGADEGADVAARAFARGALLAARGNSGVIVSQYLAGLAEALPARADGAQVAQALRAAATAAMRAVADPQEGTVLTLARVMGEAAVSASCAPGTGPADVAAVLRAAAEQGRASLGPISAKHPQLRAAHVLDAGACGLLVLVQALARVAAGQEQEPADLDWLPASGPKPHPAPQGGGAYEVMLLVRPRHEGGSGEGPGPGLEGGLGAVLSARMQAVGDSVAVVGAEGLWNVHVHTDDPARAIAEAAVGARDQVVVRLLRPEDPGCGGGARAGEQPVAPAPGVVACTASPELAAALAAGGAVVLVRCDGAEVGGRNLQRALTDASASRVVLLPGDASTAEQARSAAHGLAPGVQVEVVEALDDLRVLVGLLALQGGPGDGCTRLAGCAAALARLRTARVDDPDAASLAAALDRLVDEHGAQPESLTVLLGHTVDEVLAAGLEAYAADRHPGLATVVAGPVETLPGVWLGVD